MTFQKFVMACFILISWTLGLSFADEGPSLPPGAFANDQLEVTYYDGGSLGKMRTEVLWTTKDGTRVKVEQRIYVDSTNELRERSFRPGNAESTEIRSDGSIFEHGQSFPKGSKTELAWRAFDDAIYKPRFARAQKRLKDQNIAPPQIRDASSVAAVVLDDATRNAHSSCTKWCQTTKGENCCLYAKFSSDEYCYENGNEPIPACVAGIDNDKSVVKQVISVGGVTTPHTGTIVAPGRTPVR